MGAALGLHVTTARFHLERLVAAGVVVSSPAARPWAGRARSTSTPAAGRPRLAGPEALQAFTELLTSAWSDAADGSPGDPERAASGGSRPEQHGSCPAIGGQHPGAWLGKVGMAVDLLDEWGYQPELSTSAGGRTVELTLHDCPFLTMARAHPDVVCGIHRGLIRGTMAAVGEDGAEVDLQPFVTERTCWRGSRHRQTGAGSRVNDPDGGALTHRGGPPRRPSRPRRGQAMGRRRGARVPAGAGPRGDWRGGRG